jgi:uncharacterized protein (DUF1684 family)
MAGRSSSQGRSCPFALHLLLAALLGAPLAVADDLAGDSGGRRSAGPGFAADFVSRLLRFRDNVDYRFRDRILSPLAEADRRSFQGLDYFEPVPELALTARFERAGDSSVFAMPTFDRRTLRYSHYGTLSVSLGDRPLRLKAFRREEAGGNRNILLVPFRDATNGAETYAGGRYIELSLPLPEAPVLDFNRAMNPLCAYDPSYACPIPPPENALEVPIRAGEKRYPAGSASTGS